MLLPPRSIAIPAGRSLVVRPSASSLCQETTIPAPETTPTDFAPPSLVNNRNAADPPELRHMPALLHHREDDDDASEASSILPGVMVANWEMSMMMRRMMFRLQHQE